MPGFLAHLREQAFAALDVAGHTVDLQGWVNPGFEDALGWVCAHLAAQAAPLTVVEVGCWKGASTCCIAERLKALRPAGGATLVAVDTWLGAPEFYTWGLHDPTRGVALARDRGYPTVFHTFTRNVKALGLDDVVAPFPLSSDQAADVLAHHGVRADAMYLDASHEYEAVLRDLEAWFPVVRPGGVLWGDDYSDGWPGVRRAVDEFAAGRGLVLKVLDTQWVMCKDTHERGHTATTPRRLARDPTPPGPVASGRSAPYVECRFVL